MVPSRVLQRIGRRLSEAQELGSYHLLEPLGTGGMGEVWRARTGCWRAMRRSSQVRPELLGASTEAESKAVLRRFEREAQATAMLSSPHTIQVFDFGATEDGAFYYVMELLTGRDLESLVREFGPPRRAGRSICFARLRTRWPTPTPGAWCIVTSSRQTSMSAAWGWNTISGKCWTSAWSR